jgi:xanthine dehydrogenase small subunit
MQLNELVHSPRHLDEALAILSERRSDLRIIAGGTDLMVLLNARTFSAREFLDIWRIGELRGISEHGQRIRIGALTSFSAIIASPIVNTYAPPLVAAARTIGAVQIQNRGTLGGNLVNGSPAGDSLPVMAAFDAEIEIRSNRGTRVVPFDDFYTGYRQTVLEPDEIVTAISLVKLRDGERSIFYKVGTRRAQAISKVMMASRMSMSDGVVSGVALSYGSVTPVVRRARRLERAIEGMRPGSGLTVAIEKELESEISPIDDIRSTALYRMRVARNLLARMLSELT